GRRPDRLPRARPRAGRAGDGVASGVAGAARARVGVRARGGPVGIKWGSRFGRIPMDASRQGRDGRQAQPMVESTQNSTQVKIVVPEEHMMVSLLGSSDEL